MLYMRTTHNPITKKPVVLTPDQKAAFDTAWQCCYTVANHLMSSERWVTPEEVYVECIKYSEDHGEDPPILAQVKSDCELLAAGRCAAVRYE